MLQCLFVVGALVASDLNTLTVMPGMMIAVWPFSHPDNDVKKCLFSS